MAPKCVYASSLDLSPEFQICLLEIVPCYLTGISKSICPKPHSLPPHSAPPFWGFMQSSHLDKRQLCYSFLDQKLRVTLDSAISFKPLICQQILSALHPGLLYIREGWRTLPSLHSPSISTIHHVISVQWTEGNQSAMVLNLGCTLGSPDRQRGAESFTIS